MRQEITITVKGITLKCDGCGEHIELGDGTSFYEGDDGHLAEKEARESGWLVIGNRHYCPNCHHVNDDDNIETKDGRIYENETLIDITPKKLKVINVEVTEPEHYLNSPYEPIDLGLPSGRKWADRNVGAVYDEDPEDYGYLMDFDSAQEFPLPEGWHIPNKEDFQELCDNCTHEWVSDGKLRGMRFTSKINGNSIFFPATGYTWFDEEDDGTTLCGRGAYGCYWSSSYYSAASAYGLDFYSSTVNPQNGSSRRSGFSVRAVQ